MRLLILTIIIATFSNPLYSQNQPCPDYSRLISEAENAFKASNYKVAVQKYNAARLCDPSKRRYINEKIIDVFEHINDLKVQAEKNAALAKQAKAKAEKNALEAEKAKNEFEKIAKASELAGLAYKLAKTNPTHALRVAEYAVAESAHSKSAKQQLHDIISNYPSNFYSNILEHDHIVSSVDISPDDMHIVTGCWDNKIKIWNEKGELLSTFEDPETSHSDPILTVKYSPDGTKILSGSMDNTIKLWTSEGRLLNTFSGHMGDVVSLDFSPDGKKFASGSWDGTFRIWTFDEEKFISKKAHESFLTSVAFSPAGDYVATSSWGNVGKIWDLDGKLQAELKGHTKAITQISFSPDSKKVLTCSWDNSIIIWDLNGKKQQQFFETHKNGVSTAIFTKDGRNIFSGGKDKILRLWDLGGKKLQEYNFHIANINSLCISNNQKFLVSAASDLNATVWNLNGPEKHTFSRESSSEVNAISISKDGQKLLAGYLDGSLTLFDLTNNTYKNLKAHVDGVMSVDISSDGKYYISGGLDDRAILWDENGDSLVIFKNHNHNVSSVKFFNNDQKIVSGDHNGVAYVWDLKGDSIFSFGDHKSWIYSLDISPDDGSIITGGRDSKLKLWTSQGDLIRTIDLGRKRPTSVAFSPDGNSILVATYEKQIILYDLMGKRINSFAGHLGPINSGTFTTDGQFIVTTSIDQTAKLWDIEGNEIQTFKGHKGNITDCSVSMDGNFLFTASQDQSIKSWKLWNNFLSSKGNLYTLNTLEKAKYNLDFDQNKFDELSKIKKKIPPIHTEEFLVALEKRIQDGSNIDNLAHQTFGLIRKSIQTPFVDEKEKLAQVAVEKMVFYLDQKTNAKKTNYTTLAFHYGILSLSQLGLGASNEALKSAQKSTEIESEKFMNQWMSGKLALCYLYNDKFEDAINTLHFCKDFVLTENRQFFLFNRDVIGNQLEKNEPVSVGDLILKDIEFLEENGVTHLKLEEFKKIITRE